MNAIGLPIICVIMKMSTPSSAKAKAIVYSRPNLSETAPHMILANALVTPAMVAVSGTMAIPMNFASNTLSDLAIWDMLPVVISPPVQTMRNMKYMI